MGICGRPESIFVLFFDYYLVPTAKIQDNISFTSETLTRYCRNSSKALPFAMLKKWVGTLQVQNALFFSTELKVDTLASILFHLSVFTLFFFQSFITFK